MYVIYTIHVTKCIIRSHGARISSCLDIWRSLICHGFQNFSEIEAEGLEEMYAVYFKTSAQEKAQFLSKFYATFFKIKKIAE